MSLPLDDRIEWLEADGLGGFASGTACGYRTRRYHGLLLAAATPPTNRFMLVNGVDATLERDGESFGLTSQMYDPGVISPRGALQLQSFSNDPWPRWVMRLPNGDEVIHELFVPRGAPVVVLSWKLIPRSLTPAKLSVRPFFSGRDYHALHHENDAFRFEPSEAGTAVRWSPYPGVPSVLATSNGAYRHEPDWYRAFLYRQERERGFDACEDLAAPGIFEFDLAHGEAVLVLSADTPGLPAEFTSRPATRLIADLRARERVRRAELDNPLDRAAEGYIVRRGNGHSIIAGYPWFADWGRDTFIAIRGLCIARGNFDKATSILLQWADSVSDGMLPNRFPDAGDEPEFNSVDASLWFIIAAHDLCEAAARSGHPITDPDSARLWNAASEIVSRYSSGARHGIRMDSDGLLACGEPGVQLTWMDARVGDRVITPRTGKPVEVQALWVNALTALSAREPCWSAVADRATASFRERFWNQARGCLFDVVDVDHEHGSVDATVRPNQILAIGGLPIQLLTGPRAESVLKVVEQELLTPAGLRSLAPGEPGYTPRYRGGPAERDSAYHQGTVWPWLIGPFVEAWLRVHGSTRTTRQEANARFIQPLLDALAIGGHIPEIADAQGPHEPRGCPFQAWSLGELIRIERLLRAAPPARKQRPLLAKAP